MTIALSTDRRRLASRVQGLGLALILALALFAWCSPQAIGAPAAPAFTLTAIPSPTNLAPGSEVELLLTATNVGGAATNSTPVSLEVDLPADLTFKGGTVKNTNLPESQVPVNCPNTGQHLSCEVSSSLPPGRRLSARIFFTVSQAATGSLPIMMQVGGGGGSSVTRTIVLPAQPEPVPFGYVDGLRAPLIEADGTPSFLAGAHPAQQSVDFGFPVRAVTDESGQTLFASSGHPREIVVDMPRGMVVDPSSTPVLCTEAELTSFSCPDASQVGIFDLGTLIANQIGSASAPIYNMVPPPGYPAEIAFNGAGQGLFIHVLGGVRSESDFGVRARIRDIPALGSNPVFNDYTQLWGNPSAETHAATRGFCLEAQLSQLCKVSHEEASLLTLPVECPADPIETEVRSNSWEQPGDFIHAGYLDSDLQENPVTLSGCNQLSFEPTISVAPTTNAADSPSGVDVALHQPTDNSFEGRSPAIMKDASVTLPEGMVANPSQADGLDACSEEQIGYLDGGPGIHFSDQPATCPDAAKLGTVEVATPLLAEYDPQHHRVVDPETGRPVPLPLHGSVYLAKPFDNPFGGLLAIYLAVEDPDRGLVAKLAGKVEPDPVTGRLTTTFAENPQLPIEDVRLHLFGGPRGALVTPPTCGTHTTTTTLVPWSAPETADAHPQSSFQITRSPAPGECPAAAAAAPNAPAFSAGTLSPQAGAYSPFVLKLSREDGSQRLASINTTLPPGLIGKLAGIAQCSEAQIAQAEARSHPEEGRLERQAPSCPLGSEVGVVNVGAGAGPSPYYVQGHAYLAGPYRGAPVSLVVITPAVAGPFDLGAVVTRVALHVEPETAQIRAVSDPLPQILEGIPLDVRSIALDMSRPQFTLNPTSCDPMAIAGAATAASGQSAALNQRFQVGGCSALPFKPKLSLRLKGAVKRSSHPRLIATLTARPGEANIARAQVKLPKAVFLDQSHIGTVCTRVQFAADACPARSVYGKVSATTPLLDYPLAGSVYLRSSSHTLPDLVAKLEGPATQPLEVDLVGRTDAVKGALRNTFEAVPDAPVSKFRLELFGGKRGLVEMSDGFCRSRRASVKLDGQNGKVRDTTPVVKAKCPKHKPRHRGHQRLGR